jgi:uncharacterized protein (TIGR02145 family)
MIRKTAILSLFLLESITSLIAQTPEKGNVTDIDGNVYRTVIIGKYEWMAENLKTTTFCNGLKILPVTGSAEWSGLNSSAYCCYNNSENSTDTFGVLYNWYAVNSGTLCPEGWRIPTDEEWKYLEGFADTMYGIGDTIWNKPGLRGNDAGRQLRASSARYPDWNGTDYCGFSALPGGERLSRNGRFFVIGKNGFWWSSSGYNASLAWYRSIIYAFDQVSRGTHDKRFGFSVRCLRDKK